MVLFHGEIWLQQQKHECVRLKPSGGFSDSTDGSSGVELWCIFEKLFFRSYNWWPMSKCCKQHFKRYLLSLLGTLQEHEKWEYTDRALGPVHTLRGAPRNRYMQTMEHIVVNGSVHTACKQHQRVCRQMCWRVLCERGLRNNHESWAPDVYLFICFTLRWLPKQNAPPSCKICGKMFMKLECPKWTTIPRMAQAHHRPTHFFLLSSFLCHYCCWKLKRNSQQQLLPQNKMEISEQNVTSLFPLSSLPLRFPKTWPTLSSPEQFCSFGVDSRVAIENFVLISKILFWQLQKLVRRIWSHVRGRLCRGG